MWCLIRVSVEAKAGTRKVRFTEPIHCCWLFFGSSAQEIAPTAVLVEQLRLKQNSKLRSVNSRSVCVLSLNRICLKVHRTWAPLTSPTSPRSVLTSKWVFFCSCGRIFPTGVCLRLEPGADECLQTRRAASEQHSDQYRAVFDALYCIASASL